MQAKAFLLQECANVKELLDSTLRYEYGLEGSRAFFEECSTRLELIHDGLVASAETDSEELSNLGACIVGLAELICRIERSALGEHSWPFVDKLKQVALACCTDHGVMALPPLIHVISDGGLDGYAMNPEKARVDYRRRLILTIVLPRSSRHHVLQHSILGHEVGHAMYRCSEHQKALNDRVLAVLKQGIFADKESIAAHIYSADAPAEVKDHSARLAAAGISASLLFAWAGYDEWVEEVLCDLVGLLTFGPSFVAATSELLTALSSGAAFGANHPPPGWRINMLLRAAEILGFDSLPPPEHHRHGDLKAFWESLKARRYAAKWYDVFSDAQLKEAVTSLQTLLMRLPPSCYQSASPELLDQLLTQLEADIPPTGFALAGTGKPKCQAVDFRHITFAGWVACVGRPADEFTKINLLCEHGIMQQTAIDLTLKQRKTEKRSAGAV